jgi:predicted patatin/cPLA2 family phospholipase
MSEEESTKTKSELIEKLTFAALPILLSCVAYLWTAFNTMEQKITILESKVSVVVTPENKPIPSEGTTVAMEEIRAEADANRATLKEDAALARAELDKRIALLEQIHGGALKH